MANVHALEDDWEEISSEKPSSVLSGPSEQVQRWDSSAADDMQMENDIRSGLATLPQRRSSIDEPSTNAADGAEVARQVVSDVIEKAVHSSVSSPASEPASHDDLSQEMPAQLTRESPMTEELSATYSWKSSSTSEASFHHSDFHGHMCSNDEYAILNANTALYIAFGTLLVMVVHSIVCVPAKHTIF